MPWPFSDIRVANAGAPRSGLAAAPVGDATETMEKNDADATL